MQKVAHYWKRQAADGKQFIQPPREVCPSTRRLHPALLGKTHTVAKRLKSYGRAFGNQQLHAKTHR